MAMLSIQDRSSRRCLNIRMFFKSLWVGQLDTNTLCLPEIILLHVAVLLVLHIHLINDTLWCHGNLSEIDMTMIANHIFLTDTLEAASPISSWEGLTADTTTWNLVLKNLPYTSGQYWRIYIHVMVSYFKVVGGLENEWIGDEITYCVM